MDPRLPERLAGTEAGTDGVRLRARTSVDDEVLRVWTGCGLPAIREVTTIAWRGWRLRLASSDDGRRIVLAEVPVGVPFPTYVDRQRLRPALLRAGRRGTGARVGGGGDFGHPEPLRNRPSRVASRAMANPTDPAEPVVIIFTDAARSRYIWSWAEPWRAGAVRYREYRLPGKEACLPRALERTAQRSPPKATSVGGTARDHTRLLRVLLPEAGSAGSGELSLRAAVGWIRGRDSARELGPVWKRVRGLRVVDLQCGTGTWLISAAGVLEAVYLAILDRVIAQGDDWPGRKPPEAIDNLLAEFEDASSALSMEGFVRRTIVRRHLFGFDVDRGSARRCRARLREYASGDKSRNVSASVLINVRGLDPAVCSGRIDRGPSGSETACGGDVSPPVGSDDLSAATEELRIVVQGWLAAVDAPEENRVVSEMRKLAFEMERRSRVAMARILGDRSDGSPRDGIELARALIGTLAHETNATIYLREKDGCTSVARGDHRARRPRLPG